VATAGEWVQGARPRTLGAAAAPILIGTGVAAAEDSLNLGFAALALIVMVAAQVGVNYANDYSDGVRGTDRARVGPVRLVGQGLAAAPQVKAAAVAALLLSSLCGLALVGLSGHWWLLLPGGVSIAAAWLYTGGPKPYGYLGLGEVAVFIFFGLVPVLGTTYVQTSTFPAAAWLGGIGVGALSCAILVANNLRDIPTDRKVGKNTLAVRIGDRSTRLLYIALLVAAFIVIPILAVPHGLGLTYAWFGLLAFPLGVPPALAVLRGVGGRALVPVLQMTGLLTLAYGALLGLGIGLS
jgi:1,4-dihydroxy-2-naphthoate octaprenyltransferase